MSAPVVAMVALGRTAPGRRRRSPSDGVAIGADLSVGEVQQPPDVRVGAEAAVADADAVLGAQPGGDEGMVPSLDGEGCAGQGGCVESGEPRTVAARDLYPAPRCRLEYQGRNSWTREATAGSAFVEAAPSRLT